MAPHADTQLSSPTEVPSKVVDGPLFEQPAEVLKAVSNSFGRSSVKPKAKSYDVYPRGGERFHTLTQAFPFPEDLDELVGWTEVFVERVGSLAKTDRKRREKDEFKINILISDNEALRKLLAEKEKELDVLRKDNADLRGKNSGLTVENSGLKTKVARLEADIELLRVKIAEDTVTIRALTGERDKQAGTIQELQALINFLRAQLGDDAEKLAEAERAFEAWKKADAIADAKREGRINLLEDEVKELRAEAEKAKATIKKLEAELAAAQKSLSETQAKLDSLTSQLNEKIAELEKTTAELGAAKADIIMLKVDKEALQGKVDALIETEKTLLKSVETAQAAEREALLQVEKVKIHARGHWDKLEGIRTSANWLRAAEDVDQCEA